MASPRFAFATLVTSDSYVKGALVVAAALRDVHQHAPIPPEAPFETVCIVTPETVDVATIRSLRKAFDVVIGVEIIAVDQAAGLKLLGRPDLNLVLTKLHVFRLSQYNKIIFLDADVLPIRPLSHLFNLPYEFSAVPDVGWPDIFNSGVLVLTPGQDKFDSIMAIVKSRGSWDGGDQGVLNEWRGNDWNRLSFTYNTTPTAVYTYAPAYERFGSDISAIHFIGPNKPWSQAPWRPAFTKTSQSLTGPNTSRTYAYADLIDRWYDVYDRYYRSAPPETTGPGFIPPRYESAWSASSGNLAVGGGFGLEELKRLAIEGSGSTPGQSGEAEYRTLPLDGRVDLMRPTWTEPPETDGAVSVQYAQSLPGGNNSTAPTQTSTLVSSSYQYHQPSPPSSAPYTQAPAHYSHEFAAYPTSTTPQYPPYHPPQSSYPLPPALPGIAPSSEQSYQSPPPQTNVGPAPENSTYQVPPSTAPHEWVASNQAVAPSRPRSPPLVNWNPAVEPPPSTRPPNALQEPIAERFTNAWDLPPTQTHHRHSDQVLPSVETPLSPAQSVPSAPSSPKKLPEDFFEEPASPSIPPPLVQQGAYSNVSEHLPDFSKVTTVFPWETQPRQAPRRVFPVADHPPPGLPFIDQVTPVLTVQQATPEHQIDQQAANDSQISPSPSMNKVLSGPLVFQNAWDTIPSIQRYVNRFVRSDPPITAEMPAPTSLRHSPRASVEKTPDLEDGHDGDDEDDGESSADDVPRTPQSKSSRGSDEGSRGGRSRRASTTAGRISPRNGQSASQNAYRSQGVQTVPKSTRSFGVQVQQEVTPHVTPAASNAHRPVEVTTPIRTPVISAARFPSSRHSDTVISPPGIERRPPHAGFSSFPPPPQTPSTKLGSPITLGSPLSPSSPSTRLESVSSTAGSPSVMSTSSSTTLRDRSPTTASGDPKRTSWFSTSSTLSGSEFSPRSTTSGDLPPRMAPAGRRWDPARGVDVFKRDSQEVLARFLKMGQWGSGEGEIAPEEKSVPPA